MAQTTEDHASFDRISRDRFRDLYGSVYPGARFDDLGFALAMSWTAPPLGSGA